MSQPLPAPLREAVEEVVRLAGLEGEEAREVRADLHRHFQDGLASGRSAAELLQRFGDPSAAARALKVGARPSAGRAPAVSRSTVASLLADLVMDVRHAARSMLARPALAITTILVLALGIGANTVVFTVASELVLRPLPVEDPERLVDVWPDVPGGNSFLGFSWEDYTAYREATATLEELVAFAGTRLDRGDGGEEGSVVAQVVSPAYFPMLGIDPHLGTVRFPEDAPFGSEPVAVLSYAWWRDALGADPGAVGGTVQLDGATVTVVGVAPPGFSGHFIGFPVDLWLPIAAAPAFLPAFDPEDPASKPLEMIGRLGEGVLPETAEQELNAVALRLESRFPESNRGHRVGVTRTTGVDHSLRAAVDTFVGILSAVAALVLVIACLNVGTVLLVRALSRERELAIRLAMGAGNGRLVRQILAEAAALAVLGAAAGTVLAAYLNGWLARFVQALTGGLGPDLTLDWRVLSLTAAAALLAAVVAGVAPAAHLLRKDPATAMRGRGGEEGRAGRIRAGLVVAQVAVSVVLVASTSLFVRSLMEEAGTDPGFDVERVASFSLDPQDADTPLTGSAERQGEILDAVRALPGVVGVARSDAPVVGVARTPLRIQVPGLAPPPGEDAWVVDAHSVDAGYLTATGITLRSGRSFERSDDTSGPPVAMVNRSFAERFWPGGEAVGRLVRAGGEEIRVVGVVENARYLVQDADPDPLLYRSLAGRIPERVLITLRADAPDELTATIQDILERVVPGHRRIALAPASRTLQDALLPQRLGTLLVGAMGLAALFMAGVGLYGLIQFSVNRSRHELGVRLALGGRRRDLLKVVLRKGIMLVAAGMGVGLVLTVPAGRALSGFLGNVGATDLFALGAVVLVFGLVAVMASWMPARRAAAVHPSVALRGD